MKGNNRKVNQPVKVRQFPQTPVPCFTVKSEVRDGTQYYYKKVTEGWIPCDRNEIRKAEELGYHILWNTEAA